MEIIEKSADLAWKKALNAALKNGEDFIDHDKRVCRELMNLSITIDEVENITKPIEIINSLKTWVYPPLEELENFALSKKEISGYYYNYGARAFLFNGHINQIDNYIIPLLKKDKSSRRASVMFYSPESDSSLFKKDVPGMIMINFNIRDERLNVITLVRSNDLFFGWPANIYQTFVIQEYVAKALNIRLGSITTLSISAHIFEDQFEHIKKLIS
jgi:thymidylate synthase